jgi:capsular exopolysaccharide synthesis family protein
MPLLLNSPEERTDRNSLAVPATYNLPGGPGPWRGGWYGPEPEPEEASVPLSHYLYILRRHRWKIIAFVAACVIATLIISSRLTPIFESTATVDIDRRMPTGVVGQEAMQSATNDADQFLATQLKLIQSDSVLRPVAEKLKLREVEPDAIEGPEQGARAPEAPIRLRRLKVTRPPNTYLLLVSYRSPDARLAAEVANAVSNSYIEHTYNIRFRSSASLSLFMERQLEELKAKMERSSGALLQFERELNVINPEEKTTILSARLLQLNTEYTNAQSDRVRKEAAFNSVRGGTLEAAQVSSQGDSLRRISERLNEAQERFAQVKAQYGVNHPEYKKTAAQLLQVEMLLESTKGNIARRVETEHREALNRESMLQQAVGETKAEFDRVNARSFEYQALKRDAEADKRLYEELVHKIREAGINAGFQSSAIRLADPARPAVKPVFPNLKLNLALAFVFSTLLAGGAAVLSDVLDHTIRDPEQVRRTLNTEVVGNLPDVKPWKGRLSLVSGTGDNGTSTALVRRGDRADLSVTSYGEAIRTLRNSLLLADIDRRIRTILVTSASPGEGKSTTAVYLAVSHAEQGKRTLLIDGDLRRPSVHKRFDLSGARGLSNVLSGELGWKEAVLSPEAISQLDVIPAGPPSRRASDLVGPGLTALLDEVSGEYDLVILDAPPTLGFAEPLQMATAVDGVIVVTRAGETDRSAVASVLNSLTRLRANVLGVVLNGVSREMSGRYYYYGGKYGKYYHADQHVSRGV